VAPAKDRRNVFRSVDCVRATIVLVTVVPMLAPIAIGIACRTLRTVNRKSVSGVHAPSLVKISQTTVE